MKKIAEKNRKLKQKMKQKRKHYNLQQSYIRSIIVGGFFLPVHAFVSISTFLFLNSWKVIFYLEKSCENYPIKRIEGAIDA